MDMRGYVCCRFLVFTRNSRALRCCCCCSSSGRLVRLLLGAFFLLLAGSICPVQAICTYTCTEEVVDHFEIELGYELKGLRNFWFFPAYLLVRGDDDFRCALFPGYFLLATLDGYECFDQTVG
jgi:hypothetical protein